MQKYFSQLTAIIIGMLYMTGAPATHAQPSIIQYGEQTIEIHHDEQFTLSERRMVDSWIRIVSDSARSIYGEFPIDHFSVVVNKHKNAGEAVPAGRIDRESSSIVLGIDTAYGFDEIVDDWTAYHEFSHLLIPYQGHGDMWFSEGIATYYQNIIRARVGIINSDMMWGKLIAGFERGRAYTDWSHLALSEVSDDKPLYQACSRVYWSGAHYWLNADIQLRRNGKSLDFLLKQLKDCCMDESISSLEIAQKLDELAGMSLFVPQFYQYRKSNALPEYQMILAQLGIEYVGDKQIKITPNAPMMDIREEIFKGDFTLFE